MGCPNSYSSARISSYLYHDLLFFCMLRESDFKRLELSTLHKKGMSMNFYQVIKFLTAFVLPISWDLGVGMGEKTMCAQPQLVAVLQTSSLMSIYL